MKTTWEYCKDQNEWHFVQDTPKTNIFSYVVPRLLCVVRPVFDETGNLLGFRPIMSHKLFDFSRFDNPKFNPQRTTLTEVKLLVEDMFLKKNDYSSKSVDKS